MGAGSLSLRHPNDRIDCVSGLGLGNPCLLGHQFHQFIYIVLTFACQPSDIRAIGNQGARTLPAWAALACFRHLKCTFQTE